MKKDLAIIFGLFLLIVILLVFGRGLTSVGFSGGGTSSSGIQQARQKDKVVVTARTMVVEAKLADNASERKKGLCCVESLPLGEGMLFLFDSKGTYTFWMKDVNFALDIIWISEDKKIVDMAVGAPPEPGKKDAELTLYKPRGEALYVLEVNAGLAMLNGLAIGDQLNFEL